MTTQRERTNANPRYVVDHFAWLYAHRTRRRLNEVGHRHQVEEDTEAAELLRGGKEGLIVAIKDFLRERGNTSSTADLVAHFKSRLSPEDSVLFRSMLKQIATFNRSTKTWTLKSEYADL